MIKTILFDYNGIFAPDSGNWNCYRNFTQKTALTDEKLSKIWDKYNSTIFVGEEKLIDFLNEVTKVSGNKLSADKLLNSYLNDITIYEDALNFARQLKKKGFNLIILSNETKEAADYKVKKYQLKKIFNRLYFSANIGMTKRNPKAFKLVISNENLNPKEILFIDDREHNVAMAKIFGMKGIVYKNLNQLEQEIKQYY